MSYILSAYNQFFQNKILQKKAFFSNFPSNVEKNYGIQSKVRFTPKLQRLVIIAVLISFSGRTHLKPHFQCLNELEILVRSIRRVEWRSLMTNIFFSLKNSCSTIYDRMNALSSTFWTSIRIINYRPCNLRRSFFQTSSCNVCKTCQQRLSRRFLEIINSRLAKYLVLKIQ